jgi:hypothetical protein
MNLIAFSPDTGEIHAEGAEGRSVDTFYVYIDGKGPFMRAGTCADTPNNRAKIAQFALDIAAWKRAEPNIYAFRHALDQHA